MDGDERAADARRKAPDPKARGLRVRPSRAVSILGVVAGGVMTLLGVVEVIPLDVGFLGVLWTVLAACITVYYAYNLLSKEGISVLEVELTESHLAKKE
jgi:hypothetical protein